MKEEVILFKRNTLMQTVALKSDIANLKSALINGCLFSGSARWQQHSALSYFI